MIKYFVYVMKHTFDYKGRARRKEFWFFQLSLAIIIFLVYLINIVCLTNNEVFVDALQKAAEGSDMEALMSVMVNYLWPVWVTILILFLPRLAVGVRRLHDTGKPGWWFLLYYVIYFVGNVFSMINPASKLTSFLGFLLISIGVVLLIWMFADSEEGENEYGPNPKEDEPTEILE